jgi:hypothetical protein
MGIKNDQTDISNITKDASEQMDIQHLISPMQKQQRNVGDIFGSKLQQKVAKDEGFDIPAQ